jgi:hypothetical protein
MRFLRLKFLSLILPVFLFISGAIASVARAESPSAPARLALAKDPAPARRQMVDVPPSTRMSDAPATAEPESGRSAWWVWAVIAAGVAGVAALIVTTSGKDPGCPSDRVCH